MPDRPAQQRWSLVTGCSGPDGLGSHIARALLAEGYGVFATSRRMETLIGLEAEGCHVSLSLTLPSLSPLMGVWGKGTGFGRGERRIDTRCRARGIEHHRRGVAFSGQYCVSILPFPYAMM